MEEFTSMACGCIECFVVDQVQDAGCCITFFKAFQLQYYWYSKEFWKHTAHHWFQSKLCKRHAKSVVVVMTYPCQLQSKRTDIEAFNSGSRDSMCLSTMVFDPGGKYAMFFPSLTLFLQDLRANLIKRGGMIQTKLYRQTRFKFQ